MADEHGLVQRAKAGDGEAFGRLIELHSRSVYHLAYRFCWDHDDADDITQETFVRAFEYLRTFRDGQALGPWLRRIAVNCCLRFRERSARDEDLHAADPERHDASPALADALAARERVREELRRLPARQRAAIVLFEMQGLNVAETAEAMGCAPGTVKRHLHRARNTLRERLADLVEDAADSGGGDDHELRNRAQADHAAGRSRAAG